MWMPRGDRAGRAGGGRAGAEPVVAEGRKFSVAMRREEEGEGPPRARAAAKTAWAATPSLRDELRAMVAPQTSSRGCAIFVHQRKRECATQAASLAASFVRQEASNNAPDAPAKPSAADTVDPATSETLRRMRDGPQDAVFRAVEKGDARSLRGALRGAVWVDARGPQGETPLLVAARLGHLACVRVCLARGARVDALNSSGESALHLASYAGHLEVVEALLGAGASVQHSTEFGESALFYAARKGFVAIARALIHHGDEPGHADRFGDTALEQASDAATRSAMEAAARQRFQPIAVRVPSSALATVLSYLGDEDFGAAQMACATWDAAARLHAARARPAAFFRRPVGRPQSSPVLTRAIFARSSPREAKPNTQRETLVAIPAISSARTARDRSRIHRPDNIDVFF